MQAGQIVFRADSGLEIGTGHVMRCLTLADALQSQCVACVFVTRCNLGNVLPNIRARGHRIVALPGGAGVPYGPHPAAPPHASWLATDWRSDAEATRKVLEETNADWLVMDHYALDRHWQEEALPQGVQLLVLDDLADRSHLADVLLDQNAGRVAADYAGLVPEACHLRIGPEHALLRPEFSRLRPVALARREGLSRPETLLITLGGVDKDNATGRVLDALAKTPAAVGLRITVVLGGSAPHLDSVRTRAATMPIPTEVAVGVTDMADQIMKADLCIGGAGSTAWERCALGLPTLQVVLADNQVGAARSMVAQGVSLALPAPDAPEFNAALEAALHHLSEADAYRDMARASAALTDGSGAPRLAQALLDRISTHAH